MSKSCLISAESWVWHCYLYLNMMFTYLKVMLPDGLMPWVGLRDLLSALVSNPLRLNHTICIRLGSPGPRLMEGCRERHKHHAWCCKSGAFSAQPPNLAGLNLWTQSRDELHWLGNWRLRICVCSRVYCSQSVQTLTPGNKYKRRWRYKLSTLFRNQRDRNKYELLCLCPLLHYVPKLGDKCVKMTHSLRAL